jgi:hypothetical protein
VKALARAFRWRRMLEEGRYASVRELAAAEAVDRAYVGRALNLTLLAPAVVEGILDGTNSGTLPRAGALGRTWIVDVFSDTMRHAEPCRDSIRSSRLRARGDEAAAGARNIRRAPVAGARLVRRAQRGRFSA